jgi:hypothetical protein
MDKWVKLTDIASHLAQTVGIIFGGIWAYFKFIRGRTFAPRIELNTQGSLIQLRGADLLKVAVSVHNAGLSSVTLYKGRRFIRLFGVTKSSIASGSNVHWGEPLMITRILNNHEWIEAQETLTEEVLIPVPLPKDSATWLAFRVEAQVWSQPRRDSKEGIRWVADAIVPAKRIQDDTPKVKLGFDTTGKSIEEGDRVR